MTACLPLGAAIVAMLCMSQAHAEEGNPHRDDDEPSSSSHWSWAPLPKLLPDSGDGIDSILARHFLAQGIIPAKPAEATTLLKRVTYDLTGLPPTMHQQHQFAEEKGPNAFAAAVERLLSSPSYSERWARHWLDVMRFAEEDVLRKTVIHTGAFRYRDFVLQSFAQDLPWDKFVLAHLAGDHESLRELKGSHLEWRAATGWLALGPWFYAANGILTSVQDEWDERVDVLGRGFLGLTVACARCHDHKTDPISRRDYFGLVAAFARTRYQEVDLDSVKGARWVDRSRSLELAKKELSLFEISQTRVLRRSLAKQIPAILAAVMVEPGNPVAVPPGAPPKIFDRWLQYLRADHWAHSYLDRWQNLRALGRKANDAATLLAANEFQLDVERTLDAIEQVELVNEQRIAAYTVRKARKYFPENIRESTFVNLKQIEVQSLEPNRRALYLDLFARVRDQFNEGTGSTNGPLALEREDLRGLLNSFDLAAHDKLLAAEVESQANLGARPAFIHMVTDIPSDDEFFPTIRIPLPGQACLVRTASTARSALHQREPGTNIDAVQTVPDNDGAIVEPGLPAFLTPKGTTIEGSGRLQIGRAISVHPLSDRAIVNRVWMWHFGQGLVSTVGDLGVGGDTPLVPELLNWLTADFVQHGRSIKHLHRRILLSAAWQRSYSPACASARMGLCRLASFKPRPLDANEFRDTLLFHADQLNRTIGGASESLAQSEANVHSGRKARRTLYMFTSRASRDSLRALFGAADPNRAADQVALTETPEQALFTLNNELMNVSARGLARRLGNAPLAQYPRLVYQNLFARLPSRYEQQAGREFLNQNGSRLAYLRALMLTSEFRGIE